MNGDKVYFHTDNQSVSLQPGGEETGASAHPYSGTGLLVSQPSAIFPSPSSAGQSSSLSQPVEQTSRGRRWVRQGRGAWGTQPVPT